MDRRQINLIDTRKRKVSSIDSEGDQYRSAPYPTPPPPKMKHGDIDLSAMLKPTIIPKDKYYAIQSLLNKQDAIITERGNEIKTRCSQIHDLKQHLEDARREAYRNRDGSKFKDLSVAITQLKNAEAKAKRDQNASTHELKERKQYYETFIDDQNQMLDLGRKVLANKTEQAERLDGENCQLRATVGDRDATISALNRQILRMSMASPHEMVQVAVEAQAQRTLDMVRGLQTDLAQRDVDIKNRRATNSELIAANEKFNGEVDELKRAAAATDKALRSALNQAAEAKAITEDQAKLIDRLMRENSRLLAGQEM